MRKIVRAFAPASISCFFKVYKHTNPRWAGSYGMGFTVDKGVIVSVYKSKKTHVLFNKKKIVFPTVTTVVNKLTKNPLRIEISSALPLGCGFGLSGASSLATAYAVNRLLSLRKTKKELAIIAHTADVSNKTGLGDVANQFYGGFFLKTKPSSHFVAKRISVTNGHVYCKVFSRLSTKDVLTEKSLSKTIDEAADVALLATKRLLTRKQNIALGDIIAIAKRFVVDSKLLRHKKTEETIKQIEKNGGSASMIVLGNAVYSDSPFAGAMKLKLSDKGAHLL